MCNGSNVTLTAKDIELLRNTTGIDGWLVVMRVHCIVKLREIQNSTLENISKAMTPLEGEGGTIKLLNETYNILLDIMNISKTKYGAGDEIIGNLELFINATNVSLNNATEILNAWKNFKEQVKLLNVSRVKSCQEAYETKEKWTEGFNSLNAETMEKLTKTPAVEIIIALDNLSKANTTYTYNQIKEMKNIPDSVKGLVGYIDQMKFKTGVTPEDFWKLVRETIVPPQSNSIEDINKSLESLLKLVEELKVKIGGA